MMERATPKFLLAGVVAPLVLLPGCADEGADDRKATIDAAGDSAATAMEAESVADRVAGHDPASPANLPGVGGLEFSLPKLAYSYRYEWTLPGEDIGKLQRRHADLCEQQGPQSCRILGMRKSGEVGEEVTGSLQLAVATRHARAFGALLEDTAEEASAELVSADIAAEEMSKTIVDTDARLRARIELRDRLLEVLRTRKGDVKDLVEAERSVAQVNEEIDQARSWLEEMKGRVAYSTVDIAYSTGAPVADSFVSPIKSALGSLGGILGFVIAALMVLGAIMLPIGGLVWLGTRINGRFTASAVGER